MSTVPVLERTVEVDSDFLPPSAAKLIITQYLECEDTSSWAWIIVGTFFDSRDQPLWSTEIFIAQLDIGSGSESEYSDNTDELYHGGSEDLRSGESCYGLRSARMFASDRVIASLCCPNQNTRCVLV